MVVDWQHLYSYLSLVAHLLRTRNDWLHYRRETGVSNQDKGPLQLAKLCLQLADVV